MRCRGGKGLCAVGRVHLPSAIVWGRQQQRLYRSRTTVISSERRAIPPTPRKKLRPGGHAAQSWVERRQSRCRVGVEDARPRVEVQRPWKGDVATVRTQTSLGNHRANRSKIFLQRAAEERRSIQRCKCNFSWRRPKSPSTESLRGQRRRSHARHSMCRRRHDCDCVGHRKPRHPSSTASC